MPRPIDMHDSVWIEDLTMLEVRDLIKAGKTTALVLTGGIEENGPYLTTGKHNNVLKATGESIARALGNALVAPIVTLEPGNPMRPNISPGTIVLSQATFQAVLTDMANSLRSQGFKDVVMVGDSGGNAKGMQAAATSLNAEWKGQGYVHFIPEYYNYADVEKFEEEKLGIHEKLEGYHDDYYITAIISTVSTDAHPHEGAQEGRQVRDQRRAARSDREDDRERQEDGRVPDGGHGCRHQEVDGERRNEKLRIRSERVRMKRLFVFNSLLLLLTSLASPSRFPSRPAASTTSPT